MQLLYLGFARALAKRTGPDTVIDTSIAQMIGLGAAAAERLVAAFNMPPTVDTARRILQLHPMFNPAAYVSITHDGDRLIFTESPAHEDQSWVSLIGPHEIRPLQSIVRAVDPTFAGDVIAVEDGWAVAVTEGNDPVGETREAAITKMGAVSTWQFEERRSLPLTVL